MSLLKSNIKKKEDFDIFVDQFLLDFELSFEKTLSLIDKPVLNSAKEVSLGGGKRYRPTLCFLCGYPRASYSELIKASIVLELVHIASMVNDDVLDNAKFRRGKLAIHHNIGVNESILLGDALFSYALELSTEFSENLVCKIVSKATRKTCSGEIAQNSVIGDFGISIKQYEQIISDKTGYLFGAACKLGGIFSGVDSFDLKNLESIGLSLGICYQLFDDIVDAFGNEHNFGKSLGSDFFSQKPTLPVLLLLESCEEKESIEIMNLFSENLIKESSIDTITSYFERYDILNQCIVFFNNQYEKINFLVDSLECTSTKENLSAFITSFSRKAAFLNHLNQSNFLAVHT